MNSNHTTGGASTAASALQAEAVAWIKRRGAGLSPAKREEFQAWLAADASHAMAFAEANIGADEFDWPFHTGTVDEVLLGLEKRASKRRRRRALSAAAASVIALGVGLVWSLHRANSVPAATEQPAFASKLLVVQPQRQTLPDGSVVELNDGAQIEVSFTEALRRVSLRHGEAHFQVTKNPARPFLVEAKGVEVRAVGTAFAVQLGQTAVQVLVTEGRVVVDKPTASPATPAAALPSPAKSGHLAEVEVGQRVIVAIGPPSDVSTMQAVATVDVNEALSWRIPRLEFSGAPLSEMVALFNRHAALRPAGRQIALDSDLENLRISGVLRADKIDALVELLEAEFPVRTERPEQGMILLHRKH